MPDWSEEIRGGWKVRNKIVCVCVWGGGGGGVK